MSKFMRALAVAGFSGDLAGGGAGVPRPAPITDSRSPRQC